MDGYKVELIRDRHECVGDGDSNRDERSDQLWFVNLGGYDSGSLQELHQFGLIVAPASKLQSTGTTTLAEGRRSGA